jgi:hypothetical protein
MYKYRTANVALFKITNHRSIFLLKISIYIQIVIRLASIHRLSICIIDLPTSAIFNKNSTAISACTESTDLIFQASTKNIHQRPNLKKNMVYGTLCRSWLRPHHISTPESTPAHLPWATLCQSRLYPPSQWPWIWPLLTRSLNRALPRAVHIYKYWALICKRLRSPGIDSKESIPTAYIACRVVVLAR